MRRKVFLTIAALCALAVAGCSWDSVRRSVLYSVYNSYGDGYRSDRFSEFNDRYDQQTKAAAEYYQQQ
jgi:hypothetical protein